jgi:thioredoxin 1
MHTLKSVPDDSFETDVLGRQGVVLVDFWAEWCGPCRLMAPELEKLQVKYASRIDVLLLNIEENPRTTELYRITSIPATSARGRGLPRRKITKGWATR